jgi:hypothetical protein
MTKSESRLLPEAMKGSLREPRPDDWSKRLRHHLGRTCNFGERPWLVVVSLRQSVLFLVPVCVLPCLSFILSVQLANGASAALQRAWASSAKPFC